MSPYLLMQANSITLAYPVKASEIYARSMNLGPKFIRFSVICRSCFDLGDSFSYLFELAGLLKGVTEQGSGIF